MTPPSPSLFPQIKEAAREDDHLLERQAAELCGFARQHGRLGDEKVPKRALPQVNLVTKLRSQLTRLRISERAGDFFSVPKSALITYFGQLHFNLPRVAATVPPPQCSLKTELCCWSAFVLYLCFFFLSPRQAKLSDL